MNSGVVVFAYHNIGIRGIESLLKHKIKIYAVFTHRDKIGENIWFNSVSQFCLKKKIRYYFSDECDEKKIIEIISNFNEVSVIFSFYYRNIISKKILKLSKYGGINLHGSMLPKYRGRSPVNWQLINGESNGGLTLHCMNEKPDTGDIVDQETCTILENDNPLSLFSKLENLVEPLIERNIEKIVSGKYNKTPQNNSVASYFGGRKPEDGLIDWSLSSEKIYNLVRGVTKPYPGAFTFLNNKKFIIWSLTKEEVSKNELHNTFGAFFNNNEYLYVQTGDGIVRINFFNYDKKDYNTLKSFPYSLNKGYFKDLI